MDTTSIKILDVTDLDTNAQFAGHLASADFFCLRTIPGRDIKGITHPVEFDAELGNIHGNSLQASGKLIIDRTKYDMRFRSGNFFKDLGDTLIYNDFTLNIQLVAGAA